MDEFLEKASSLEVICLFGFSLEEAHLFKEKVLVFFTKDPLWDGSYQVYYDGNICDVEQFQQVCQELVFCNFGYFIHPNFLDSEKETAEKWIQKCQMIEWQVQLKASEWQDFGVKVFKNLINSSKFFSDNTSFASLKNVFQKVPAFICGAGPSLEKEIPYLKMIQNKGLVFAGGAALGCLGKSDVKVDIAAGIDPDPCYEKVLMQNSFEAPFFYQQRFAASILQTIQGVLFQVGGNPESSLENWLQDKIFDGGWTVSTFCAALALHLGCDPIVFVGLDLAFSEKRVYAQDSLQADGIRFEDSVRGNLDTKKDWVLAAKWLEGLVQAHPEKTFYTTSFVGLSLQGIKKSALDTILTGFPSCDIEGLVQTLRSCWTVSETSNKMQVLEKSVENSLSIIEKILNLFEKYYPNDPSEKGEFVLYMTDLEEEIAYQMILSPIWSVWQFPLYRKCDILYGRQVHRMIFFKNVLQEYRTCLCKEKLPV